MTWLFHITVEYHFLSKFPRFPFSNLGQLHLQLSSLMHGRTLLTNLRKQMRVSEALDQILRGPLMSALMQLLAHASERDQPTNRICFPTNSTRQDKQDYDLAGYGVALDLKMNYLALDDRNLGGHSRACLHFFNTHL